MNDVILCYKEPYFIMNFKNLALKNNKINKLSVLFVMEKFSNSSYFAHLIH
ncbi:hypothetical protein LMxysn_2540 [Listeria monocytogenes]|nr:hypothetical protein LMxysn_2540 [Listeria monocytogenes]